MKSWAVLLMTLYCGQVLAKKDVKISDLNKELITDMQKDLASDNAQDLKVGPKFDRRPASIAPVEKSAEKEMPESKIDKQFKQLGSPSW
jgi:hypothetical protein